MWGKHSLYGLLVLLSSTLFAIDSEAQPYDLKEVRLNAKLEGATVLKAFKLIESKTDFRFTYNRTDLDRLPLLRGNYRNTSVYDLLNAITAQTRLSFRQHKETISVSARLVTADSETPAHTTITGQTFGDAAQTPLPGVNILVKGTSFGTTSDSEGHYQLEVPDDAVLILSFIGYQTQEVTVGNRTTLDVSLEPDVNALEEVVVVGYASQRMADVIGAVGSVRADMLADRPVVNTTQALQGLSPGLIIQQQSSEPGAALNVNVRGVGTLGNASPLVIVDGVPGSLDAVNPNDIEHISVLKDAASSAIYGSRAANGVIVVTTKRGAFASKPQIAYNGMIGWQSPAFQRKPVSGYDYAILKNEARINSGQSAQYTPEDIRRFREQGSYPWYLDEVLRDHAWQQHHNIGITGGAARTSYLVSVGRVNQESIFEGPSDFGYTRTNARINLTTQVTDRLKTTAILAYTRHVLKEHAYTTEWIIGDAARIPRIYPVRDSSGQYYISPGTSSNALARLEKGGKRTHNNDDLYGNINGEYTVLKGLTLKGVLGMDLWNNQTNEFRKMIDYAPYIGEDNQSSMKDENRRTTLLSVQAMADYKKTINDHTAGMLVGYATEKYTEEHAALRKLNVDNDFGTATDNTIVDEKESLNLVRNTWALNSLFGRVHYDYKQRFLAEVDFRYDGSSRFAPENRWGFFPSLSAGWRISDHAFMAPLRQVVNDLKLRASWGRLGNQNVSDNFYPYLNTIFLSPNIYGFNNDGMSGAYFSVANADITWETSTMTNVGIDADLFGGCLTVSADYFVKRTKDILLSLPVAGAFGASPPVQNAAVVDNRGWEMAVTWHHKTAAWNHTLSANLSDNLNEVVDVRGTVTIDGGDRATILQEGYPINSYYGYRSDGFFQNQQEVEAGPKPAFVANGTVYPGDIRYVDRNDDKVIDQDDRVVLGNPFPRYTFGINYNVAWKGFDFSLFIQGVGRRQLYLRGEGVEAFHNNWDNVYKQHLDRWTPTNSDATYPRLTIGTASTNNNAGSDFWMYNAAYARFKNVQLGYSLPRAVIGRAGLTKARIYISGQNLVTLTRLDNIGFDPEISEFNNSLKNVDTKVSSGRVYPSMEVFAVGVDLTF
jgi:TonB-linked SusC/RagA family outer membrane protein